MMFSINPYLGISLSHGTRLPSLQNQVGFKNPQPFFVWRPVRLSQNMQLLE